MEDGTDSSTQSEDNGDEGGDGVDAEMSRMLDLVESKCSICFFQDSDLELPHCGDQFCLECIERYWIHWWCGGG